MVKQWKPLVLSLILAGWASSAALGQPGQGPPGGGRPGGRGGMMSRNDSAPKVGQEAPTFKLKSLDGKKEMNLAEFRGKRPVVLFFGSYT